jgi:hypothetical protein
MACRLTPIALSVFGRLPILLGNGVDGSRRRCGGRFVSLTILTLFVVPAVYVVWRSVHLRRSAKRRLAGMIGIYRRIDMSYGFERKLPGTSIEIVRYSAWVWPRSIGSLAGSSSCIADPPPARRDTGSGTARSRS